MISVEADFNQEIYRRSPLQLDSFFGQQGESHQVHREFFAKILSDNERLGWKRWPVPLSVYKGMSQVEDGIVQVVTREKETGVGDLWATKMLAPRSGGELLFWPNTTAKVLYLAALQNGDKDDFPDYAHSCKELDELLMGAVPFSFFTDLSRAGILGLPKAYGYVHHTLGKHEKAGKEDKLDAKLTNFYRQYGMFGCVPITSRVDMFNFIQEHELASYMVPGSSVAEAFTTLVRRIGSEQINAELSQLKGNSWVSQDDRSGTGMLADRMDGYLRVNYPDLLWIVMILENKKILLRNPNFSSLTYPFITLLSQMVMKMVEEPLYKLPEDLQAKNQFWINQVYKKTPEAVLSDVSELVVKRAKSNIPLAPLPWQGFILYGHQNTFVNNTYGKMLLNAQLIRHYYPDAWVFMMVDEKRNPMPYDLRIESENVLRAKQRGKNVTQVSAKMQGIVEFAVGKNIQDGIKLSAESAEER